MAITATSLGASALGGTTGTTFNHTTTAAVPAASLIVVGVSMWSAASVSVSGVSFGGLTWTNALSAVANAGNYHTSLWWAYDTAGHGTGTVAVTTSASASDGLHIHAAYLTNITSGASPVDNQTGTNNLTGAAPWATSAITTTNANDGLVGFAFADGTTTNADQSTPGAGFTELNDANSSGAGWGSTLIFQELTSTGSYTAAGTWTSTPSFAMNVAAAAFIGAGGGGPASPDATEARIDFDTAHFGPF